MSDDHKECYECDHCGQQTTGEPVEQIDLDGQQLNMCCLGCACAAQLLHNFQSEQTEQAIIR